MPNFCKKSSIELLVKFWPLVMVSIFSLLLITSLHREEASKRVSVTKNNFEEIKLRLEGNDTALRSLEMQFLLTEEELKMIHKAIQNNTELGYINWHKTPHVYHQIFIDIENKLIENNKNYRYHPSDYVHALLSQHVYVNSKKGDTVKLGEAFDEYLKDWRVESVHNHVNVNGYYGVIYKNDKTHQLF